ncbi:hypothetical protein FDECE_10813 [Fusarium decemcellulare]|nr:hypothetical protein FDECE_10813 [Fusarium decemcellulare]
MDQLGSLSTLSSHGNSRLERVLLLGPRRKFDSHNLSVAQQEAVHQYLFNIYNATGYLMSWPFLVIGCRGSPPSEDDRPSSVAGAISIWRGADDMYNNAPLANSEKRSHVVNPKPKVSENKSTKMEVAQRKLLRSKDRSMGDMYMFESPTTGKQKLEAFGRRFTVDWMPHNNAEFITLK